MTDTIRWGILATGKIAHSFARDLVVTPGAELVAVGSRNAQSASAFAATYGAPTAHASYDDLVADPAVDVVYIATPHSMHLANSRLAFAAGKHVLCEKPLTLNAADAQEMVRLAHEHDRFLMEAMWMACHPVIRELAADLRAGRFGAPRQLHAELGFRVEAEASDRMFDPALGASALLDMGVYPLTFAHLMLGRAESLGAVASLSEGGTDLDIAISGRYPGGALATMSASMTSRSSCSASIATDLGRIELPEPFHHPAYATFTPATGGAVVRIEGTEPVLGAGYGNEISEVGRCLGAGLRESPWVPHEQTLTLMQQLDDLRAQVGVVFPTPASSPGSGLPSAASRTP